MSAGASLNTRWKMLLVLITTIARTATITTSNVRIAIERYGLWQEENEIKSLQSMAFIKCKGVIVNTNDIKSVTSHGQHIFIECANNEHRNTLVLKMR